MGWFSSSTMSRGIATKEIKSLIKLLNDLGDDLGVIDDTKGPSSKDYSDNVAFHKGNIYIFIICIYTYYLSILKLFINIKYILSITIYIFMKI